MSDTDPVVRLEVDGGLARVTLARPASLNALDARMKSELTAALRAVARDASVRAVLLTAEGKHFCVGQDLDEHVGSLHADRATAMDTVGRDYNPLLRALADIPVPVVAGVQGACAGAGWGLAMAADIRVVGGRTSFRSAFTGIALAADSGLSATLTRALGPSRAAGILLLGDAVTAEQALEWGMVHRVVDDADDRDAVAREAEALARGLAEGPTRALAAVKGLIGAADGLDAALEDERRAQETLGASDDHLAAVEAFLAKEKPVFRGR